MKKYILNLFVLVTLFIIVLEKKSFIALILLIYLFLKRIDKKVIFIFIAFALLISSRLYHEKVNYTYFENEIFTINEVKDHYFIIKNNKNVKFIIYKNDLEFKEGNKIVLSGIFNNIRKQGVPYLFDFSDYCKYKGIKGEIDYQKITLIDDSITYKEKISSSLLKRFSLSRPILNLIILGKNSDDVDVLYESMINLSIIHLFVISGFHFNFIYIILKKIVRSEKIIIPILFFYLYLLNFSISASRAFFYLLFKKIDNKKRLNSLNILSLVGLLFIFINPYVIFLTSFILSFTLSFVLELIKPLIRDKESKKSKLIYVLIPYLSTLPLIINLNGQISLYHLIMQLVVTPFIPLIYGLSFLIVLIPLNLDFYYYNFFESLKLTFVFLESKIQFLNFKRIDEGFLLFYYSLLYLILYNLFFRRNSKVIILSYTLCLTLIGYNKFDYNAPAIYFLDVGQGDSILIRGKNNSYNVLIDTGGSYYSDIASKVHIPLFNKLGIHYLDAVFISHDDYDHSGALQSLSEQIKIKSIIKESIFNYYIFNELVIYNLNKYYQEDYDDNEKSQILYFKFLNHYFLCTGDMSIENEVRLMNTYSSLKVDILKVAHHGSNTSSSKEFLDFINPKICVISVGSNNKYGHPHKEVLNNLKERNIRIYRTDKEGTIKMELDCFKKLKIIKTILN